MGSIATQKVLTDYAGALNQIEQLETAILKSIEDLKKIKTGEIPLTRLIVTDNGYEIMPTTPDGKGKTS